MGVNFGGMQQVRSKAEAIRQMLDKGAYAGPHQMRDIGEVLQTPAAVVRQVRIRHKASNNPGNLTLRLRAVEIRLRDLERRVA